jgi:uncharacterized repeat protein (TIGR01451 family)
VIRSHLVRILSLVLALALSLLFLQPQSAAAQPTQTYTLAKTFSTPFTCNAAATAPPTGLTFAQTQTVSPGQCVAVNVSITNNTGNTLTINNLALSDTFSGLVGQPNYGCPRASTTYTCTVTAGGFSFSTNGAANNYTNYSLAPTAGSNTGTETFVVQVPGSACGSTISNTATAPTVQNVTTVGAVTTTTNFAQASPGLATATLSVTGTTCPTGTFTATKTYTVNGLTASSARPNDSLTWYINITNNTGATATGVTVTDTLQPGQALLVTSGTGVPVTNAGWTCNPVTPMSGPITVTCTTPSIASGSTASLALNAIVTGSTSSISNTASVTANGGALSATAGPAVVAVVGTTPTPTTSGQLLLCGPLTAYTPPGAAGGAAGSITISGITVPIAAGSVVSGGYTFTFGSNTCVTFAISGGVATALSATASTMGATGLACGAYNPVAAGTINVGGVNIAVAGGASFTGVLTPGVTYCFLINGSGQAYAALSGIPTAAHVFKRHGYAFHRYVTRAE